MKYTPVISVTLTAQDMICEGVCVTANGKIARKGDVVFGLSGQDAEPNQPFTCHVMGVFNVIAGEDLKAGTFIGSNNQGRIAACGYKPFGRALLDAEKGHDVLICTLY